MIIPKGPGERWSAGLCAFVTIAVLLLSGHTTRAQNASPAASQPSRVMQLQRGRLPR